MHMLSFLLLLLLLFYSEMPGSGYTIFLSFATVTMATCSITGRVTTLLLDLDQSLFISLYCMSSERRVRKYSDITMGGMKERVLGIVNLGEKIQTIIDFSLGCHVASLCDIMSHYKPCSSFPFKSGPDSGN